MKKLLKNNTYWVGKSTGAPEFHGTTVNEQRLDIQFVPGKRGKTVLIDTVWAPYAKVRQQLSEEARLDSIDYIITNHGEVDHSGSLP